MSYYPNPPTFIAVKPSDEARPDTDTAVQDDDLTLTLDPGYWLVSGHIHMQVTDAMGLSYMMFGPGTAIFPSTLSKTKTVFPESGIFESWPGNTTLGWLRPGGDDGLDIPSVVVLPAWGVDEVTLFDVVVSFPGDVVVVPSGGGAQEVAFYWSGDNAAADTVVCKEGSWLKAVKLGDV
jgi:hypothetical protein